MQINRLSLGIILWLCVTAGTSAQAYPRIIVGRYHNPAEGFSVRVPRGLKGMAGDQAGPERGVSITLGENLKIVVYGEPNSLDWKDAAQAVRSAIEHAGSNVSTTEVTPVRLGSLAASRAILKSMTRASEIVVAFRPGGGPVYWARLESDGKYFPHDHEVFMRVVQSFQVEAWK